MESILNNGLVKVSDKNAGVISEGSNTFLEFKPYTASYVLNDGVGVMLYTDVFMWPATFVRFEGNA
jgi:hypothetical protein